jgi:hypothetical protein
MQAMEDDIVLQAAEEPARLAQVEALRGKFAAAALLKINSKEKGVSWSAQESEAEDDPEMGKRDAAAPQTLHAPPLPQVEGTLITSPQGLTG